MNRLNANRIVNDSEKKVETIIDYHQTSWPFERDVMLEMSALETHNGGQFAPLTWAPPDVKSKENRMCSSTPWYTTLGRREWIPFGQPRSDFLRKLLMENIRKKTI